MSNTDARSSSQIRFDAFAIDLRTGELHKAGTRIPLQQQPFRVLARLLDRAGEVVTREALRHELWPSDTFVDFEHGLNVAIARVREALDDEAEHPRFIETLPKRGYRFIAPVERATSRERRQTVHTMTWIASLAIVLGIIIALSVVQMRRQAVLTERDTILVADFVNKTGEDVFDDTLRQALTIDLEQSPFLSVVSRGRVGEALEEMTRSPDTRVIGPVAHEVCQRAGAVVSIDGTVARVGVRYVLDLEAAHCESGETIAHVEDQADRREDVIRSLGRATASLRSRLGESRATMRRFNQPLEQATTRSLEALKAYSAGQEIMGRLGFAEAVPFLERAVALDPDFAMAHAKLVSVYLSLAARPLALPHAEAAYTHRDRVTERERLYIDSRHCAVTLNESTGPNQPSCNVATYDLWRRTYPRDAWPHMNLSGVYLELGQFAQAVESGETAIRLAPDNAVGYMNLASAYLALNRFDDVKRTTERAIARHIATADLFGIEFRLGFTTGDATAMQEARRAVVGRSEETFVAELESDAAAAEGRMARSRELRRAAERMCAGPLANNAVRLREIGVLYDAAVGERRRASTDVRAILPIVRPQQPVRWGFLAAAAALADDRALADELRRTAPIAAAFGSAAIDVDALVRAQAGDPDALASVPADGPADLRPGLIPPLYFRGVALIRGGDDARAALEFQRMLALRGIYAMSPFYALAVLQQARAYTALGNTERARQGYETFLRLWKDGDPDVPILKEAKAEYATMAATR